jgi:hypothetical protein
MNMNSQRIAGLQSAQLGPSLATNVNAIGIRIVQIGGALKTEIRARKHRLGEGLHLIKRVVGVAMALDLLGSLPAAPRSARK